MMRAMVVGTDAVRIAAFTTRVVTVARAGIGTLTTCAIGVGNVILRAIVPGAADSGRRHQPQRHIDTKDLTQENP